MAAHSERDGLHNGAVIGRIKALAQTTEAKMLVVDDDELELALLCDRLQSCGLVVHRATNGEEAQAQAEKQWFPVVLTD